MGMDTGAYKKLFVSEDELVYEGDFDEVEGVWLQYPNGEIYELASTLEKITKKEINLRKYLICDEFEDAEKPDFSHIMNQLEQFNFEKAIEEIQRALLYIEKNKVMVKKNYRYIHDPLKVAEYVLTLWKKRYYITYNY